MSDSPHRLVRLLRSVQVVDVIGDTGVAISSVTMDSRKVKPGSLFVAIAGQHTDGHEFVDKALERGAVAIVLSRKVKTHLSSTMVVVADPLQALASISAEFYGHPSSRMTLVGITGTNGKTTITYLLESVAKAAGLNPGVIGTVNIRYADKNEPNSFTTPQAPELQELLGKMANHGVEVVLMEVSSHGLELKRVLGIDFNVGVFTNLTRDHLDFHADMESYAKAKALLFNRELVLSKAKSKIAVVNGGDPRWKEILGSWDGTTVRFGLSNDVQVHPVGPVKSDLSGIKASIKTSMGHVEINSRLVGDFNLENITAAVAVADALGIEPGAIGAGVASCPMVPGRLERVSGPPASPAVFVDYAHTDDALKNVISALAPLTPGRLIVVFGCGGDRDKGKRPLMGKAVAAGADLAVVTSDNPRTEDPLEIIDNVVVGLREGGWSEVSEEGLGISGNCFTVEPDRRSAIELAIRIASEQDVVLIAGKGHETYQLLAQKVLDFDDRIVATELLTELYQTARQ